MMSVEAGGKESERVGAPRLAWLRLVPAMEPDGLAEAVGQSGVRLEAYEEPYELLDRLQGRPAPEVVVIDRQRCDGSCRGVVLGVRALAAEVVIVVRLGEPDEAGAWWLIEQGVEEVLSLGEGPGAIRRRLERWLERGGGTRRGVWAGLGAAHWGNGWAGSWSGLTVAAGASRRPLLIVGERGSGKTCLARRLHEGGGAGGPLIEFRTEGLPESALEAMLFRREGRSREAAPGALEQARGGTLLIEEVAGLPRAVQTGLLERLGEGALGCRLMATTSVELEPLVRARKLSGELYGLLAAMRIEVPPLRDRRHEIPGLVAGILGRLRTVSVPPVERVAPEALRALMAYAWPGNVRELEEVIRRAVGLTREPAITLESLPESIACLEGGSRGRDVVESGTMSRALKPQLEAYRVRAERSYLERLLTEHRGQLDECVKRSGMTRRRLIQCLRRHGLDAAAYRVGGAMGGDRQLVLKFSEPLAAEG
jgi:DNA-binding NtrC family response regulator